MAHQVGKESRAQVAGFVWEPHTRRCRDRQEFIWVFMQVVLTSSMGGHKSKTQGTGKLRIKVASH